MSNLAVVCFLTSQVYFYLGLPKKTEPQKCPVKREQSGGACLIFFDTPQDTIGTPPFPTRLLGTLLGHFGPEGPERLLWLVGEFTANVIFFENASEQSGRNRSELEQVGTSAERNCPWKHVSIRKGVWKTRKKTRKTIRNVSKKYLGPLMQFKKYLTDAFYFFQCQILAQKKFTATFCWGGHANSELE